MAHECPECCDLCYCGGDIDDMLRNDTADALGCYHACDRERDDDDCLGCGTCRDCVALAIGYTDEMEREPPPAPSTDTKGE